MSSYKEMYYKLFNSISNTIDELQKIQQECEEMYLDNEPKPSIHLVDKTKPDMDKE